MPDSDRHHLLLLGAGFSRNWGGWLATEADEYLLGHPSIDKPVRDILWQCRRKGGFEAALAHLQQDKTEKRRLQGLQEALRQMFDDMDNAFQGIAFDFNNDLKSTVTQFLTRFDAIFTLNQDLLLERHYLTDNISLMSNGRWNGFTLPGLQPIGQEVFNNGLARKWKPIDGPTSITGRHQAYIKLHGSSNWISETNNEMLVMGGNKPGIIDKFPLLKWYHDEFRARLTSPSTRLMVIGYSFGDAHINKTIQDACKSSNLNIFIIDPLGVDTIDKNRNSTIYSPDNLILDLWPNLLGASRRSLREIFGSDRVEYEKVMRFFN